jgi:hypothetical protein
MGVMLGTSKSVLKLKEYEEWKLTWAIDWLVGYIYSMLRRFHFL